jgi:hypothetical protein
VSFQPPKHELQYTVYNIVLLARTNFYIINKYINGSASIIWIKKYKLMLDTMSYLSSKRHMRCTNSRRSQGNKTGNRKRIKEISTRKYCYFVHVITGLVLTQEPLPRHNNTARDAYYSSATVLLHACSSSSIYKLELLHQGPSSIMRSTTTKSTIKGQKLFHADSKS